MLLGKDNQAIISSFDDDDEDKNSLMPFSSILNRQNKHRLGDQNESLIIDLIV